MTSSIWNLKLTMNDAAVTRHGRDEKKLKLESKG
jgi:hypothetical protein